MFHTLTVSLGETETESADFPLAPTSEESMQVCSMLTAFLSTRPLEFRDKLGFLRHGNWELEWSAASGGTALASFFESGEARSMALLFSGENAECDQTMMDSLKTSSIGPFLGDANDRMEKSGRPLLLLVLFPGHPDEKRLLQMLATALASVFFRCIHQLRPAAQGRAEN